MVKDLLYKWEDSAALSHHCGFCSRPLHHPGARASCFGTHSEPCHRYHQAMFMRLRSHSCRYCRDIDEAHHRRHKKIAEGIRDVYESCGEVDWSIIPSGTEERGRSRDFDAGSVQDEEADRADSEEAPSSKRERKDAKNLARAASRSRVISQDEIVYVDQVIHSSDGVSSGDDVGPCNTEEMEEIDRHLKFNAHVYSQGKRRELRTFARVPDVDVDFDSEIERILEAFRVTELLKRNTRNRGLEGRELKTFQLIVVDLKKMLVDDLVSVKRDALEIRMRRAGYLRYTNKTAHGLVEDRYADKDWKTGEWLSSHTSDSSNTGSPLEEVNSPYTTQSPSPLHPPSTKHGPDLRHLEKTHLRVNGDDGLGQRVIEPYHAPLLPLSAETTTRKRAVQLRVVTNAPATLTFVSNGSARKQRRPVENGEWQTVLSMKKPAAPFVKPAWGTDADGRPVKAPVPAVNPWGEDACEITDLRSILAAEVQSADAVAVTSNRGPDGFVGAASAVVEQSTVGHDAVVQKKAKKYEREARRKAKKVVVKEEIVAAAVTTTKNSKATSTTTSLLTAETRTELRMGHEKPVKKEAPLKTVLIETTVEVVTTKVTDKTPEVEPVEPSSPAPRVTQNDKHSNWMKFKREFIVDHLTAPCLQMSSGCSHGTSCAFEANGVPDCPFHEPHCGCVDPIPDECYLVYPCNDLLSSGPYNRLRGEKLFAMYQKEEHFAGRIMLVDNDLLNYFMTDPHDRMLHRDSSFVPKRLATEYADCIDGYNPGPLMEQEKQFERLWNKNNIIKRKLTQETLMKAQRDKFEVQGAESICYCYDAIPAPGLPANIVKCAHRDCVTMYFHKACVKKLGVDKVSRWMCTSCEQLMRLAAHRALQGVGYDHEADEVKMLEMGMERLRKNFGASKADMEDLRERLAEKGVAINVKTLGMVAKALAGLRGVAAK